MSRGQGAFYGVVLPRGRSRNCLRVRMGEQGRGVMAAATCGHGRCELPAILTATPKIGSG